MANYSKLSIVVAWTFCLVAASAPASATTLTFSEFPVDTFITTQYAAQGVVFSGIGGGDDPIIAIDNAMPGSPVLSPSGPLFVGRFQFVFPSGATGVQFDSGYWDFEKTAVVQVYDTSNVLLAQLTNLTAGVFPDPLGIFHFDLSPFGVIGRVTFDSSGDQAGGDIDNLQFQAVPLPAALPLFASGLAGLGWLSRRKRKQLTA